METVMPRTKAEPKDRVDVYLPPPLVKEIEAIAEADGWTTGEFYRLLIINGLAVYSEQSNKRLVNEKMRREKLRAIMSEDESDEKSK